MEMLCPECLSTLPGPPTGPVVCPGCRADFSVLFTRAAARAPVAMQMAPVQPSVVPLDEKVTVRCPTCGRQYQLPSQAMGKQGKCNCGVTFTLTSAGAASVSAAPGIAAPVAPKCRNHPSVPATSACSRCGAWMCSTCSFARSDGSFLCPSCASSAATAVTAIPGSIGAGPTPGTACRKHPQVAAIRLCATCRAPMCSTCDFGFPGDIHLCPTCATAPRKMSGKRKGLVVSALGLATWSTIGIVLMFSGALAGAAAEKGFEVVIGLLVGIPAIVGGALGFACMDRRLGNPPIVWVAAIWNGVLLTTWVVLCVIGSFM